MLHEAEPVSLETWLWSRRMTQAELAAQLGVTRQAVWGWLRGSSRPSFDVWVRLERLTEGKVRAATAFPAPSVSA